MLISEEHINSKGTLHGGFTATLVDGMSSLSLISSLLSPSPPVDQSSFPGAVSVELSVSYLNPVKTGETIVIEAETIKQGKTIAFLDVKIRNKSNGKLIATGKHTKFILSKL